MPKFVPKGDLAKLFLRRAIVRHDSRLGRKWLEFRSPVKNFTATQIDEVAGVLDAVDEASQNGLWVVGFVSYDAASAFDGALASQRNPSVPLAAFAAFQRPRLTRGPADRSFSAPHWEMSVDLAVYEAQIATIRELIAAGETYQVNYTMRLSSSFSGEPEGLFAALSRAQRSDHLAFLDFGDAAICSVSPEQLISRRANQLVTRPMKGTRPRHLDKRIDRELANELVRSEKDRAENTMIVDMARNDLGRVADVGSVRVAELHTVEHYPTVHQMTSTVTASSSASLRQIFEAVFPGASITGAPKVAASRIIADLEEDPRGVYTGSVGVVEPGGDFEFNTAIRTAWVDKRAGVCTYGVGGGIIWDSRPEAEWQEAHHKAEVLVRATQPFRLLETLALEPEAGPILLDRHLKRLAGGAEHFGYDVDVEEIRRRVNAISAKVAMRVKVLVGQDGAIEIQLIELAQQKVPEIWNLAIDTLPISSNDVFLRFKTTKRERYDQARARFPEADDVLLWNERGEITESTIANLVLELDGELVTPAESCGLLPGTLRAELLSSGRLRESVITQDHLAQADSLWLINSVRGWIPSHLQSRLERYVQPRQ